MSVFVFRSVLRVRADLCSYLPFRRVDSDTLTPKPSLRTVGDAVDFFRQTTEVLRDVVSDR